MTTSKQIKANTANAQQSTGPKSKEGKAIVSKNAIKHGIFTNELIISAGDGKENIDNYNEILDNLASCLNPQNQMESLLVEKIAVDTWRLKRILRFETGTIRLYMDDIVSEFYRDTDWTGKKENTPVNEINEGVAYHQDIIEWNSKYIKCLKKGIVKFDSPEWKGYGIVSDIEEDIWTVIDLNRDVVLSGCEVDKFDNDELTLEEMRGLLKTAGFTDSRIRKELIVYLGNQSAESNLRITELKREYETNLRKIEVKSRLSGIPKTENIDKITRYEKTIQKSIFQNLAILKKLQSFT